MDEDDPFSTHRDPARVRAVYDDIASHFAKTRASPWPEVTDFLDEKGHGGGVGLDLGCGNGRHSVPLAAVTARAVGVDLSRGLLAEASASVGDERLSLLQGDATAVPLGDGRVDVALYVATLHHLPDRETRVESLGELRRMLAPGGRALVSAWTATHDRFDAAGETVPRFYHIYARSEFEKDIAAAGLTIEESFLSSGNCYAVCIFE